MVLLIVNELCIHFTNNKVPQTRKGMKQTAGFYCFQKDKLVQVNCENTLKWINEKNRNIFRIAKIKDSSTES